MDETIANLRERVAKLEAQSQAAKEALELAAKTFDTWKVAHNGLLDMLKTNKDTHAGKVRLMSEGWVAFVALAAIAIAIIDLWIHK